MELGPREVSFDFFALLNIFISIVMGTFMLKEDQTPGRKAFRAEHPMGATAQ